MIKLVEPTLTQLTPHDAMWAVKASKQALVPMLEQEIVHLLQHGILRPLRVTGDADGIILWQLKENTGQLEFHVWSLAGQKFLKNLEEIYEEMLKVARKHGCRRIVGEATRKGMEPLYKKLLNVEPVAVKYVKELYDG